MLQKEKQNNLQLVDFIMLKDFFQRKIQRNVGKHYFLENIGRC